MHVYNCLLLDKIIIIICNNNKKKTRGFFHEVQAAPSNETITTIRRIILIKI